MKKQWNARLSEDAILAIKIKAKEWGCSEAEVIERTFTTCPSTPVRIETETFEAPKDKRAVFEALKAKLSGTPVIELEPKPLSETPCAPFDVNVEGEPHRVTQMGKRLGLFYLGASEPTFTRYLADGELESLWEKRNA